MDKAVHQAFIDRHNAAVKKAKAEIIASAVRAIAPRRVLSDPSHARELFLSLVLSKSRPLFRKAARIGAQFAEAKRG